MEKVKTMSAKKEHPTLDLYSMRGCPGCATAKNVLKDGIKNGDINIIDVSDDNKIAKQLTDNFGGVPVLIAHEDDKICELDIHTGDVRKCVMDFIKKNK